MPLSDLINLLLRDHEGYSMDGQGGVGALPVGDRSTARKPIDKRDLRQVLLATAAELASIQAGVYPAAGVAPALSFGTATNTNGALYLLIGGRLYISDENGPFQSADGRRWAMSSMDSVGGRPILVFATGQSNMLGHSVTSGDRRTINGQVWVWEQIPGAGQTVGWKLAGPDSPDWPFVSTGNNLAYHFCDILQRATGRPVYLVMHAAGGQPIAEWLPSGGGVAGATGHMFSTCNAALTAARTATLPTGGTLASWGVSRADYMLWHQGEADADYRGTTGAQWIQRFRSMVATMRDPASGGSSADPFIGTHAPVLVGELLHGGTSDGQPTDDRNAEIARLDREEPLIAAVSSRGLASVDNLHFTGAALQEFGWRYFSRLGVFPKRVPDESSVDAVRIAGRLMRLRGLTGSIAAGTDHTVTLPVAMANAGYVPALTLLNHGASTPYPPILGTRTMTSFVIRNTGGQNMTVAWSITDIAAT